MLRVKFKRLHKLTTIPKRADELCGGWDVTCTEIVQESEDKVTCKLGFALQIPVGYKVTLVPRSSFTNYRWILQNSPGLGDASYTGEYQYRFRAIPEDVYISDLNNVFLVYPVFPYNVGDRIGQIYLEEVIPIEFEESEELSQTERGDGGFGSSGV